MTSSSHRSDDCVTKFLARGANGPSEARAGDSGMREPRMDSDGRIPVREVVRIDSGGLFPTHAKHRNQGIVMYYDFTLLFPDPYPGSLIFTCGSMRSPVTALMARSIVLAKGLKSSEKSSVRKPSDVKVSLPQEAQSAGKLIPGRGTIMNGSTIIVVLPPPLSRPGKNR